MNIPVLWQRSNPGGEWKTEPVRRRLQTVLLNDTRIDNHHGCDTVVRTIHQLAAERGIDIVAASPAHADWRADRHLITAMEGADLLIVNGEGTIHHDSPAGRRLVEIGPWAADRAIPAALINATWHKNSAELSTLLKSFALVAVRESASANEIRRCGIDCLQVPDLALYPTWSSPVARAGIGFTDSVVPEITRTLLQARRRFGGTAVNILHSRSDPLDLLRDVKRYTGPEFCRSPSAVWTALAAVAAGWMTETTQTEYFVQRLSRCRLLVTGRFHAVMLALATKTPVLAVGSNTHKIEATLRDAGLDPFRMVKPDDLTPCRIEKAAQWTPEEAPALDAFVASGRRQICHLFDRIGSLVQ